VRGKGKERESPFQTTAHRQLLNPKPFAPFFLLLPSLPFSLPLPAVVRIWDAYLWEGWKVVYRVSLAVLLAHESQLRAAGQFEDLMGVFKAMTANLTPGARPLDGNEGRRAGGDGAHGSVRSSAPDATPSSLPSPFAGRPRDGSTPFDMADRLMNASLRIRFKTKDLALLDEECAALQAARLPSCGPEAGSVLRGKAGEKKLPEAVLRALYASRAAAKAAGAGQRPVSWAPTRGTPVGATAASRSSTS
jgi:hypothetical protein